MRIIISGGSGFIGSYIIDHLCNKHEVFIIGRNSDYKYIKSIKGELVPYFVTDYSLESLNEVFRKLRPAAVIHLAAQRLLSNKGSYINYIDNLSVSLSLFSSCLKNEVFNVVNASSIAVYSFSDSLPWREDITPMATNEYGLSKILVEDTARYYNSKGLRVKSIRIAQVIGLGERSGFVLQSYLQDAINGKPLKVYGNNIGKRHYIYVKDIASAVETAINKPEESGIYNIGMKQNYSFSELAETINNVFGNKAETEYLNTVSADENQYLMCITKAQQKLNWEPSFDLLGAYSDIKKELDIL